MSSHETQDKSEVPTSTIRGRPLDWRQSVVAPSHFQLQRILSFNRLLTSDSFLRQ